MDPEIERALLDLEAADQYEADRCEELAQELELFDLNARPPSSDEDEDEEESNLDLEYYLAPSGISIFKNDIHSLYTEDYLLWPFKDSTDRFCSAIDRSILNKCIENAHFLREVSCTEELVEYIFHAMCCTSDERRQYSSYNTLMYLLKTCKSVPDIEEQLRLALINLGADLSKLKTEVLEYRSLVIPDSCDAPQGKQISRKKLRKVLVLVLQFLSVCLASPEKHADKHPDELILLFIALGLDPKIIDMDLDIHIGSCISHCLSWYPTDEDCLQSLKSLVKKVLEYCEGDVLSVVHLCRAYIIPTPRGKIFRMSLTFHDLQIHLGLQEEDFVSDVQAKNVFDLLKKFYEIPDKEETSHHSYYTLTLLDLCFHDDYLLQPNQRIDIVKICDLIKQEMSKLRFHADDVLSAILSWYVSHVTLKWKRPAGIERMLDEMTINQTNAEESEKSAEALTIEKELRKLDLKQGKSYSNQMNEEGEESVEPYMVEKRQKN